MRASRGHRHSGSSMRWQGITSTALRSQPAHQLVKVHHAAANRLNQVLGAHIVGARLQGGGRGSNRVSSKGGRAARVQQMTQRPGHARWLEQLALPSHAPSSSSRQQRHAASCGCHIILPHFLFRTPASNSRRAPTSRSLPGTPPPRAATCLQTRGAEAQGSGARRLSRRVMRPRRQPRQQRFCRQNRGGAAGAAAAGTPTAAAAAPAAAAAAAAAWAPDGCCCGCGGGRRKARTGALGQRHRGAQLLVGVLGVDVQLGVHLWGRAIWA